MWSWPTTWEKVLGRHFRYSRILAKGVNCLHPEGGDPCGECEICKGIDNGSLLDVVEMDAASNNGVDDIRDLRDETAYRWGLHLR